MHKYDYAKLRAVDVQQMMHQGQPMFYLRDPLELSPHSMVVPQLLGVVLAACDGRHTVDQMLQEGQRRLGPELSLTEVEYILNQLDEVCLLENGRADEAKQQALKVYRAASHRPPAIAGRSYPADPTELRRSLQAYMDQTPTVDELEQGHGLISPHIDYYRGGPVYAQVWKRVAKLAREADCVIFLGTDHNGWPGTITLTRQNYATPFGVLPTDQVVIDAIVEALGDDVFEAELHHRKEHSIELAAVWLHFIRDGRSVPIVPILCGSFYHFINNGHKPADNAKLNDLIEAVKRSTQGKKVLYVAAGDLAHIGPAFDGPAVDERGRVKLKTDDDHLLAPVFGGNADDFFEVIRAERGQRNVCGTSSIYLAMKMMGPVTGEMVSYDRCLADEQGTSFVSVCGVTFS
jgi:AmmeMemoRadiSam system protein B